MWIQTLKTWVTTKNKYSRGFSILEMAVAMGIISVLTVTSTVGYRSHKNKARLIEARSTLGSIVQQAKVYKSTVGYYVPNLKAMGVSAFNGLMDYSYTIVCEKGGGKVYGTSTTDACGSFTDASHSHTEGCGIGANVCAGTCWQGYVFSHSLNCNSAYIGSGSAVPCAGSDNSDLYKSFGSYGGLSQFQDVCQKGKELGSAVTRPTSDVDKFKIVDSYGFCNSARKENETDLRSISEPCAHSKKYVMEKGGIEAIYTHEDGASAATDPLKLKNLLSGPDQLVVTAIGCQNKESGTSGCENTDVYQIMSFSSRTNMYTERVDRKKP